MLEEKLQYINFTISILKQDINNCLTFAFLPCPSPAGAVLSSEMLFPANNVCIFQDQCSVCFSELPSVFQFQLSILH